MSTRLQSSQSSHGQAGRRRGRNGKEDEDKEDAIDVIKKRKEKKTIRGNIVIPNSVQKMDIKDSSSSTLCRFGIFGTAKISHKIIRAINKSSVAIVTCIGSRDIQNAKLWAHEQDLNEDVLCCSYIDLVNAVNVDCVYIPLPCALRKEWAIDCAKAGKSILIEKPTAVSSVDLLEIITVCKENNVQFMDGTHFSHHDRLDKIKTFLNSGEIGQIVRINSCFSFYGDEDFLSSNIRTNKFLEPFGCIGDLGWYNIRFCLWALDLELPLSVRAFTTKWSKGGTPIDTISHLYWSNGIQATFDNSFMTAFRQSVEIAGTTGTLSLDDFVISKGPEQADFKTITNPDVDNHHERVIGKETIHSLYDCNQEVKMIKTFSALALSKTINPHWPLLSLKTQVVLDALMESIQKDGVLVLVKSV